MSFAFTPSRPQAANGECDWDRARTFMKSIVSSESRVGLLLFDEPSAALDPKAEHDLFTRLRELRGNKTMIFSSHRFGKLTRHADLILYVPSSRGLCDLREI